MGDRPMMPLTKDELDLLKSTRTEAERDSACDMIKGDRGGEYPPDWYARVLASGLALRKGQQFHQR